MKEMRIEMESIIGTEDFAELVSTINDQHPGYFEDVLTSCNYLRHKETWPEVIKLSSGTILRNIKDTLNNALENLVEDGIFSLKEAQMVRILHNRWSENQAVTKIQKNFQLNKYRWN